MPNPAKMVYFHSERYVIPEVLKGNAMSHFPRAEHTVTIVVFSSVPEPASIGNGDLRHEKF
jgi:hypothetical protein